MNVQPRQVSSSAWSKGDWWSLGLICAWSFLLRAVLFTGYAGSDDINSSETAFAIAHGTWGVAYYPANLRYGISIPIALSMRLFGFSEFTANLWTFLCSVGEVALVFGTGRILWNRRAGLWSAVIISVAPLHVSWAGRISGDAPLAFFITLSLVLFFIAERHPRSAMYFAAGLAAGIVFWIKEVGLVFVGVFFLYGLVYSRWRVQWLWMGGGGALMILANLVLFQVIAGDAFHYIKVAIGRREVLERVVELGDTQYVKPVWFYFKYLFLDLRHTWLLGYLAAAGLFVWLRSAVRGRESDANTKYVVVWAVGLVVIFTFLVVNFSPITFVPKQINYMLIFFAPLVLLGGFFVARLGAFSCGLVMSVVVMGSVMLAALEQQAIRVLTANSKAAWAFAREHREAEIYGTVNAVNLAEVFAMMEKGGSGPPRLRHLSELAGRGARGTRGGVDVAGEESDVYVILDRETIDWGKNPKIDESSIPACWEFTGRLQPMGFGVGARVVQVIKAAGAVLPHSAGEAIEARLAYISSPKPALVYRVRKDCSFSLVE